MQAAELTDLNSVPKKRADSMQPLLAVVCALVLSLHAADDRAVDGGGGSCSSETLLPSGVGRRTRNYIIKDHVKRKPWPKEGDGFALPATKLDQPVVLTGTRYAARSSLRWWTPARLAEKIPGGRMENVKRYAMLPCLASHSTPQSESTPTSARSPAGRDAMLPLYIPYYTHAPSYQ